MPGAAEDVASTPGPGATIPGGKRPPKNFSEAGVAGRGELAKRRCQPSETDRRSELDPKPDAAANDESGG